MVSDGAFAGDQQLTSVPDSILNYVDGFSASNSLSSSVLPFAAEAAWSAGKWEHLERTLGSSPTSHGHPSLDFNVGVGRALLALRRKDNANFKTIVASLRDALTTGLSPSTTASIKACHDHLVKLHALYEMEAISGVMSTRLSNRQVVIENLDRRLDIIGAYTSDKQYLLGLRRATMSLSRYVTLLGVRIFY
jgi:serine/threonine-protein kinase ATR